MVRKTIAMYLMDNRKSGVTRDGFIEDGKQKEENIMLDDYQVPSELGEYKMTA